MMAHSEKIDIDKFHAAFAEGVSVQDYDLALKSGATDDEILEALAMTRNVHNYVMGLVSGMGHQESIEVGLRTTGDSEIPFMDALRKKVRPPRDESTK